MGVRIRISGKLNNNLVVLLSIIFWFFNLAFSIKNQSDCLPTRCMANGTQINIAYPFRTEAQPQRCGRKGFTLSCGKNNQTYIHIPPKSSSSSGDKFYVTGIDYTRPSISVSDPNGCLHRRLLDLSLSSSPFSMPVKSTRNASYIRCKEDITKKNGTGPEIAYIPCLSNSSSNTWFFVTSANRSMAAFPSDSNCETYDTIPLSTESFQVDPVFGVHDYGAVSGDEKKLILTWDYLPSKERGSKTKGIVIGTVVGGSIFTTVTLILAYYIYSKPREQGNGEDRIKIEKLLKDYSNHQLAQYSYAAIKKVTENFKHEIGKGGYGTVYKGKLSSGLFVAVKILENSNGDGKDFINEIAAIGAIHHVNVVHLLGFCLERSKRALIYEFLPNESLEKHIFYRDTSTHQHLSWKKLLEIAIGIARGIDYLHHGCNHRILHLDIKPHNILLDKDFNPKISDFGLARICSNILVNVNRMSTRGTMGYIAPELFSRTFGVVSNKSDVYSFGMVMLEMVGGRKTRYEKCDTPRENCFQQSIYNQVLRSAAVMEEDEIARKLTIVAFWCIQMNPNDRPPIKRVLKMLEGETENIEMPQNPFASSESGSSYTSQRDS